MLGVKRDRWPGAALRVGVHVEEQINNLRAQLLRSEQEKELMRVKLQEEQQQREKAQKQVGRRRGYLHVGAQGVGFRPRSAVPLQHCYGVLPCTGPALLGLPKPVGRVDEPHSPLQVEVAKKLMFQQRDEPAEGMSRKQSRRETWCPGKSAWAAPAAGLTDTAADTPTQSGESASGHVKHGGVVVGGDLL